MIYISKNPFGPRKDLFVPNTFSLIRGVVMPFVLSPAPCFCTNNFEALDWLFAPLTRLVDVNAELVKVSGAGLQIDTTWSSRCMHPGQYCATGEEGEIQRGCIPLSVGALGQQELKVAEVAEPSGRLWLMNVNFRQARSPCSPGSIKELGRTHTHTQERGKTTHT